jgi:hypothetical protein
MTPRPPQPQPPTPLQPSPPPQPPAAPGAPNPPIADLNARVRELAKMLHEGKRDDVLHELKKIGLPDLDALENALIGALSRDEKLRKQANGLRRIIRFVRNPPYLPHRQDFIASGGTKKETKLPHGTVTLRTGVQVQVSGSGAKRDDAYSLTYTGSQAAQMQWLQFIWRQAVPEFPAAAAGGTPRKTPVKMRLDNVSGPYHLTTDPANPRWTTDTSAARSAFWSPLNRSSNELAMFDAPDAMPWSKMAELFKSANPPARVVSRFHAATYLIHGMDVLYCADIDLTWEFASATFPPVKVKAQGVPAKELESAHRARLAARYPEVDYLPGPAIGAPQPADAFDPVPDLAPKDWDKTKGGDLERYADIAALAHAELIDDVTGKERDTINSVSPDVTSGGVGLKPGLNYSPQLAAEGQTGYIDASSKYHNPDLPADRHGPLPKVAIKLGETAFKLGKVRDKAFALGTMRHEMTHATHAQLAIGWLLKWRDELTETPFGDWLAKEKAGRRISGVDFALVSSGISPFDLKATEALAWTEGFVTALPFLPATPELDRMKNDESWPGAIIQLRGAGKEYEKKPSFSAATDSAVKKAVIQRIHGICSSLTQTRRDTLLAWIRFLLNPKSLNPTAADETTINFINSSFAPIKDFLKEVEKACAK